MKLFKHLIAIILLPIFSVQTLANEKAKFEIFMSYSPYAKFTISYKDYDAILNTFVLPMRKSSRAKAEYKKY